MATQVVRYLAHGSDIPTVGVLIAEGKARRLSVDSLAALMRMSRTQLLENLAESHAPIEAIATLLAPVDGLTEVWGAGVTYMRSRQARMEESEMSADVYWRVYEAERPELFFKSNAWRVVGNGATVRIRRDSTWNVPEAEVAVVVNSSKEIIGYSICNDMSSRDIEGENPLYLPQAKIYDGSCALGPAITIVTDDSIPEFEISINVDRNGSSVWEDTTSTRAMRRSFAELVSYFTRELDLPDGAVLATGTGMVPETSFTLELADTITIQASEIGTLVNSVA